MERGVAVKDARSGMVGGGSLRDLSKNILHRGWVKAKVVRRWRGVLKVLPPLPPKKF